MITLLFDYSIIAASQVMMNAAKVLKKPPRMNQQHNRGVMFNRLRDMLPGWSDNSVASGTKFLETLCDVLWKVNC